MKKLVFLFTVVLIGLCGITQGQVLKQIDLNIGSTTTSTSTDLTALNAFAAADSPKINNLRKAAERDTSNYNDAVTKRHAVATHDSGNVTNGGLSINDLAAYVQTKINNAILKTVLYPKRFLLPAYVDTTVAAQNNNNVTVQVASISTTHPDSGAYNKFISEDADATTDTCAVTVLQDVISPFDSLVVFVKSNAAAQKAIVKITGSSGLIILNQTITTSTTDCWVRYAFPVAATVIEQDYTVLVTGIVDNGYYIMVSRVTAKRV
jgi:hypothetical protein